MELLEDGGLAAVTVEGVARTASVGKQTIYRWWDGDVGALVLDATLDASDRRVPPPDTGSLRGDLAAVLGPVVALHGDRDRGTALANRSMMAQAQLDEGFAARWATLHEHWRGPMRAAVERGVVRGELDDSHDPGLVVDLLLGSMWYRLLLGHRPVDDQLVDGLLAVVGALAPRSRRAAPDEPRRGGAR